MMLNREEIASYAQEMCVKLLERTARRSRRGELSFKPDQVGYIPAYLENLCRPFWGIAPLLKEKGDLTLDVDGEKLQVSAFLRDELVKGLTEGGKDAWDLYRGHLSPYVYENQNITELAGLMIGLFFARGILWDPLSDEDKKLIADGLYTMAETAFDHSWPNNHYWFPLFTFTVLKRFGFLYPRTDEMLEQGLGFLDSLYIGSGWYKDGEFGRFDYYEAWSLHLYPLLWTLIADESFCGYDERKQKYIERTNKFLGYYTHWFGSDGAQAAFGRSLSYRFAASALFPVAVLAGCDIDPALAGRIAARNIGFFREHYKSESAPILEEGYLYHSPGTVEGYTSDGGAYWCCKTFLMLLIPENHPFWNYDSALLPAEAGNGLTEAENKDIQILTENHDGIATIFNNAAQYYLNGKLTHHFGNMSAWYGKFVYSSACGFACSTPDTVSYDSMISLETADTVMASHRVGMTDCTTKEGVQHSIHVPFSNDPETKVETWVKPLGNGMHLRVHRVKLERPYRVREGGFSLPRWDDYCPSEQTGNVSRVENREYVSCLRVYSDTQIKTDKESCQAGYHLYAPLASYPCWKTGVLEKGEYVFATVFGLFRVGNERELPAPEALINSVMR